MPFQLSAGVNVSEIDLTTVVPAVSTSVGAIAGVFGWGPLGQRVVVDRESILISRFGKPTNLNAETWFTASNFLGYANQLIVVRTANNSGNTPSSSFTAQSGNNVLVGTTTGIVAGMYVSQTNSTATAAGNNITVSSVNATAIVLSQNSTSNTTVSLYFANPNTTYSALGVVAGGFVANLVGQIVENLNDYTSLDGTFDTDVLYLAKYPGGIGNSLRVSTCSGANVFASTPSIANTTWLPSLSISIGSNSGLIATTTGTPSAISNTLVTSIAANVVVGDTLLVGNASIGTQYLKITSIANVAANATVSYVTLGFEDSYRLSTDYSSSVNGNTINRYWEYFNLVDIAPGQSNFIKQFGNTSADDELHVVVSDAGGLFTGVPGTVLEVYKGLSRATDAKGNDTSSNYYKTVINEQSQYIWWANDRSGEASANAMNIASSTNSTPLRLQFVLGSDGHNEATLPLSIVSQGYDLFASAENVDVSIVMQGKGNWWINRIWWSDC